MKRQIFSVVALGGVGGHYLGNLIGQGLLVSVISSVLVWLVEVALVAAAVRAGREVPKLLQLPARLLTNPNPDLGPGAWAAAPIFLVTAIPLAVVLGIAVEPVGDLLYLTEGRGLAAGWLFTAVLCFGLISAGASGALRQPRLAWASAAIYIAATGLALALARHTPKIILNTFRDSVDGRIYEIVIQNQRLTPIGWSLSLLVMLVVCFAIAWSLRNLLVVAVLDRARLGGAVWLVVIVTAIAAFQIVPPLLDNPVTKRVTRAELTSWQGQRLRPAPLTVLGWVRPHWPDRCQTGPVFSISGGDGNVRLFFIECWRKDGYSRRLYLAYGSDARDRTRMVSDLTAERTRYLKTPTMVAWVDREPGSAPLLRWIARSCKCGHFRTVHPRWEPIEYKP